MDHENHKTEFRCSKGRRATLAAICLAASAALFAAGSALYAHSVAQVQTTKFFAPETVQLLIDRATAGHPGFLVGQLHHSVHAGRERQRLRNGPVECRD